MTAFLLALAILAVSGLLAAAAGRRPALAAALGAGGAAAGCALGLVPAARVLAGGAEPSLRAPWAVPYGEIHLAIDPLSALFLLPVFGLSLLAAVYGAGYLRAGTGHRSAGAIHLWFNLLAAAMALVVTARNGILFLMAWEGMSLASYFLVTHESEREEVREAGWTYLIASHLGTAFLLVLFALLCSETGSMGLEALPPGTAPSLAGTLFLLAVVGFGTKAGFVPLHVWLPEAHPAAPSHVSALMSGAMIKLGIYGIARVLTLVGAPRPWWGPALVAVGLLSGLMGVLYALAQHDLKRLLAYHSIENIGIIAVGLGVGVLGLSRGSPLMSALGFAGALLHVLNHALFKGLLFLGAGSVARSAGTRDLDRLGGLLKPMPWTGALFLAGAMAICGLPPLNGFVSEWLIYVGAFQGALHLPGWGWMWPIAAIAGLALAGGLAAACFAKAFGAAFLGTPRQAGAAGAREASAAMLLPMGALALGCLILGLWPSGALRLVSPAVGVLAGLEPGAVRAVLAPTRSALGLVAGAAGLLLALAALLALLRRALLRAREVRPAVTWDCGYAAPTARMQYSASSFAQPLVGLFAPLLRTRVHESRPGGAFPAGARFSTHTPDAARETLFGALFEGARSGLERLRWLQHGRVQLYLLYIVLTLVALLIWELGL